MTEPSTDLHDKKEHEAKHAPHPVHESLEHSQKELVKEAVRDETAKEKIEAKKEEREKEAEVEKAVEKKADKAEKPAGKKAEKKTEKKVEYVLQRKVVIPLSHSYAKPAKKRAGRAIKLVRAYAARHTKSTEAMVKIDEKVASFINARGSKHPPKKLKVSLVKDKEGNVKVLPA